MSDLSRIQFFLEVVKHNSFTKAGETLGLTGSAVSKQVKYLEDSLQVQLLIRTTRHLSLTEEGEIYYNRCHALLEDLEEAKRLIQDQKANPVGSLRLNAPMSLGVLHLTDPIAEFAQKYPDIQLSIDFDDRHIDIISEGYDVLIRVADLTDSSLIARKLADCPILLCASQSYLDTYGIPQTPYDLHNHKCLIYTRNGIYNNWVFEDNKHHLHHISVSPTFQANISDMLLSACCQGNGIAALPVFSAAQPLQQGRLKQVLPDYQIVPKKQIYAIYPQNKYLPSKTKLLISHLADYFKTPPWQI